VVARGWRKMDSLALNADAVQEETTKAEKYNVHLIFSLELEFIENLNYFYLLQT
jgi:hypothetical protein